MSSLATSLFDHRETERALFAEVDRYCAQLANHPLAQLFAKADVPRALLNEYAALQYVDSVLWVPMLALMKDRVSNVRLKKALRENLMCEAGVNHVSHITLCRQFIESLGLSPMYGDFHTYSNLATQPVEMMNSVVGLSEAEIAGWILVAEAIVPTLFAIALPAFSRIDGVDLTYLREHITVDADEHAEWMKQSVSELLAGGACAEAILTGIHLGGRTALAVPDALYAKVLRSGFGRIDRGSGTELQ